jgi:glycosyltransferase involved in cell wall biosynthesis
VLFLGKLFPWPLNTGARQRVFHLVRGLAGSFEVSYAGLHAQPSEDELHEFLEKSGCARFVSVSPRDGRASAPRQRGVFHLFRAAAKRILSDIPSSVEDLWSDTFVRSLEQLSREHPVDAVYATQSWTAEHARAARLSPILVDLDDLLGLLTRQRVRSATWYARKPIDLIDAHREVAYERRLPRRFASVVVAKSEDRSFFAGSLRDRVAVVPNGVSVPPLESSPAPSTTGNSLLFVGTLIYPPNIDAVRWFAVNVLPLIWSKRPDVTFTVAGFGSGARLRDVLADSRCRVLESPPDLAPIYARADVVVAPIRIGGGTRIKILDALAHSRAVVATTFAAEGLGLQGGVELEYADSAEETASRCLALLVDAERRAVLGANGRKRVEEQFDWKRIEQMLPGVVNDAMMQR